MLLKTAAPEQTNLLCDDVAARTVLFVCLFLPRILPGSLNERNHRSTAAEEIRLLGPLRRRRTGSVRSIGARDVDTVGLLLSQQDRQPPQRAPAIGRSTRTSFPSRNKRRARRVR